MTDHVAIQIARSTRAVRLTHSRDVRQLRRGNRILAAYCRAEARRNQQIGIPPDRWFDLARGFQRMAVA